jgi:hypothetical protein
MRAEPAMINSSSGYLTPKTAAIFLYLFFFNLNKYFESFSVQRTCDFKRPHLFIFDLFF